MSEDPFRYDKMHQTANIQDGCHHEDKVRAVPISTQLFTLRLSPIEGKPIRRMQRRYFVGVLNIFTMNKTAYFINWSVKEAFLESTS